MMAAILNFQSTWNNFFLKATSIVIEEQSVPITTNVVSSNPTSGKVY